MNAVKMHNDHPKGYAKCRTPEGDIVYRRAFGEWIGNFYQLYVRHNGRMCMIGSGDEYMRDAPDCFNIEEKRKI